MAKDADANTVKVKALKYFKGHEGEGTDGNVAPGHVLTITRQRAADLHANGLVEHPDGKQAGDDPAKDAAVATDERADTRAAPASADKRDSSTVGSVTVNDKRKPQSR